VLAQDSDAEAGVSRRRKERSGRANPDSSAAEGDASLVLSIGGHGRNVRGMQADAPFD
jgi:hypothetical protein